MYTGELNGEEASHQCDTLGTMHYAREVRRRGTYLGPVLCGRFEPCPICQVVLRLQSPSPEIRQRPARRGTSFRPQSERILRLTTSASCGSLGSGVDRRDWSETRQVRRVKTGLQLDLRMSRQMKPVWDEISEGVQGRREGNCAGVAGAGTKKR